jgi:peptidoglycan/LPS O-acetylase OafA/YrhL
MPRPPFTKGARVSELSRRTPFQPAPSTAVQLPVLLGEIPAQREEAAALESVHRHTGGTHRAGPRHRARVYSLDGLRGVAAVVVFVHHVFLTQPALAEAYRAPADGSGNPGPLGPMSWLFTHTPLHLVWAGTEAVFVFFVLSGLVLALPTAAGGRIDLAAYYPRRLLRLYLPVWAAVVLALGWAAAVPRDWDQGDSWWLPAHAGNPTAGGVSGDLLLIPLPGTSNHVLWSLQWEVAYCLALPAVLVLLRVGRRLWWLKVTGVLAALAYGAALDNSALWYLSIFGLGTLMALERPRLAGWATRLNDSARSGRWWSIIAWTSIVLLLSYWFIPAAELAASAHAASGLGAVRGLQAVGGCGVVFVAWFCPAARDLLNSELAQWFGDRSFSIYLVHLPVVVAVTSYLGGQPHLFGVLILSALVVFPLAVLFHRYVEQPAHRLARSVGQAITNARSPEPRPRPIMAELVPAQRAA